jgi:hypothetical protein
MRIKNDMTSAPTKPGPQGEWLRNLPRLLPRLLLPLLLALFAAGCAVSVSGQPEASVYTPPAPAWPPDEWPEGTWFVAPDGDDAFNGSFEMPFATITRAQQAAQAGDTVYIRGGVYAVQEEWATNRTSDWASVFMMSKSGEAGKRINYWGYPGERPVFDFTAVTPGDPPSEKFPGLRRVQAFYVTGSWLHFKNFEIVGLQVRITGHTQSEGFRLSGGSYNIIENIAVHDGMGNGVYLSAGSYNLILNCDAYRNWDTVSEGGFGENTDGFGCHPATGSVGNVFRGCRAWLNSDDGFDCISAWEAVTYEHCWSFWNGYSQNEDGSLVKRANGLGFKGGGWGMGPDDTNPVNFKNPIPNHIYRFNLASRNGVAGFHANYHMSGDYWYHNTSVYNPENFNMLARLSIEKPVAVPGWGHVVKNNVSYRQTKSGPEIINVQWDECDVANNTFDLGLVLTDADFLSVDDSELTRPRKDNGDLPDIDFMRPAPGSQLIDRGIPVGFAYRGAAPDLGWTAWYEQ